MKRSKAYWSLLRNLRQRFLEPTPDAPYWSSVEELEAYHESFGERIRWKAWALFEELALRDFRETESSVLLDWGCGTGVFTEAYLDSYPDSPVRRVHLVDHSAMAVEFATGRLSQKFPHIEFRKGFPDFKEKTLTLMSHVLNECSESAKTRIMTICFESHSVLWLESGTAKNSRNLIALRERLRTKFNIVGPCPHTQRCPLLDREADWCHNFASIPNFSFHDSYWQDFSDELQIDRHSLPYSYLALSKSEVSPRPLRRQIGQARTYKAWHTLLSCNPDGSASELTVAKRGEPDLFKRLKKNPSLIHLDPL
jgi:hypothetical protein